MKHILKLLFVLALLLSDIGCTGNTDDISFFEKQLSSITQTAGVKGKIRLKNQDNWRYFLICAPYSNVSSIRNITNIPKSELAKISKEMEAATSNRVYQISGNDIVSKDIKIKNISIDEDQGLIVIEKQNPVLYYLVPQNNLIYLYEKSEPVKNWQSRNQINTERLKYFEGKGKKLNYLSQNPYPDVSTPESLMKTFFKAWEQQDKVILAQCVFPEKDAAIFLRDGRSKGWESVRFVEIQMLEKPSPVSYMSDTKATHRVIVTLRHPWNTKESVDVPYSYFLREINGKWQIVSWTMELDYGS